MHKTVGESVFSTQSSKPSSPDFNKFFSLVHKEKTTMYITFKPKLNLRNDIFSIRVRMSKHESVCQNNRNLVITLSSANLDKFFIRVDDSENLVLPVNGNTYANNKFHKDAFESILTNLIKVMNYLPPLQNEISIIAQTQKNLLKLAHLTFWRA